MRLPLTASAALLLAIVGCNALTGEAVLVQPAIIVDGVDTAKVTYPDTVAAGATFNVTITTIGGGCTREIARTDVFVNADTLLVRPLNRQRASKVCPADFASLTHDVSVRITTAGRYVLQFVGTRRDPEDVTAYNPAFITRRFIVR